MQNDWLKILREKKSRTENARVFIPMLCRSAKTQTSDHIVVLKHFAYGTHSFYKLYERFIKLLAK